MPLYLIAISGSISSPFIAAGVLVESGRADRLYDLDDTRQFDRLADQEKLPLGEKYAPF